MNATPLADLFEGQRPRDLPVALAGERILSYEAFRATALRTAEALKAQKAQRWVLACEDAWGFATGLFAIWLAGGTAIVPPNFQPGTLAGLISEGTGVLSESPDDAMLGPWCSLRHAERAEPGPLALPNGLLEFWTSGTTGEPKPFSKSLAQLEAEVVALEQLFGDRLGDGPVLGTVPHHHIYGCLFRVLWPLAAGRPFLLERTGDPDRLAWALERFQAPALVASPAHLSRLPHAMDFRHLRPPIQVFSSGGPLERMDALAWRNWVPKGVAEVYGSTESGGIAWRIQTEAPESSLWTPFPDVSLAFLEDGALRVDSFRAGPEPLRMEDQAQALDDGRFRLLGRLDRIVKLQEKRISLPALEQALEKHPWVLRAAVILVPGPRPTLGAAIVLREGMGLGSSSSSERRALVRSLRGHLASTFDGAALPKRWRFPAALPYDDRGKLLAASLIELFPPSSGSAEPSR